MPRPRTVQLALLTVFSVAVSSCTAGGGPLPSPTPQAGAPATTATPDATVPAVTLHVIADLQHSVGSATGMNGYVQGMELAVDDVNAQGGIEGRPLELARSDHGGDESTAASELSARLAEGPAAVLFVGPGPTVGRARSDIETAGIPVFLLEGDLYSTKDLFREVFQTTIPWEWQAHAVARYIVLDRGARSIVFLGTGPEARAAEGTLQEALSYWGGPRLSGSFDDRDVDPQTGWTGPFRRAGRADWVVAFGPAPTVLELVNGMEEAAGITRAADPSARPGVTGASSLLVAAHGLATPEPGTTAPYTYTWAGWAEPVKRVGDFRAAFRARFGRLPAGMEQEGYDAVRVLAEGLEATGGEGGPALAHALEGLPPLTFSGFPISLGPDDHLFGPRDHLGMFAVAGPQERLDPWMSEGSERWRPLLRSFTSGFENRTNVLERDRRVFFPTWRKRMPAPKYWRSRYGVITRPLDPLH